RNRIYWWIWPRRGRRRVAGNVYSTSMANCRLKQTVRLAIFEDREPYLAMVFANSLLGSHLRETLILAAVLSQAETSTTTQSTILLLIHQTQAQRKVCSPIITCSAQFADV